MGALHRLSDHRDAGSLATRLRRKRFARFERLVDRIASRPVTVLDVGGTPGYWKRMGGADDPRLSITTVNPLRPGDAHPRVTSVVGDATDLSCFADASFDIAYSNSVIEHVGGRAAQARMVREMCRVGRSVMLQTPSPTFPIEPHFLFPWFGLLPHRLRVWLVMHRSLGHHPRAPEREAAEAAVDSVQLLHLRELRPMFPPDTEVWRERIAGVTKSFVLTVDR